MAHKLGKYITQLMTTIVDKEQTGFVKDLAYNELNTLKTDINQFLKSQEKIEEPPQEEKPCCVKNKCKKKQEKQLLQEEKENVK